MPSSSKKFQVFVSSTFTDLKDERLAAISCIEKMGLIAAGMEKFPAGSRHAWDQITATIDDSDYYILLLGSRYGSLGPGLEYSYTEMEYRYALERQKPLAAFLKRNSSTQESDDPKLKIFRDLVQRRLVQYWDTSADLSVSVATSVHQLVRDFPAGGWKRDARNRAPVRIVSDVKKPRTKIEDVVGSVKWLTGAVNFDEDLHFSSFYLRKSVARNLPLELRPYGYSKLVAVFDDLNEKYFIQESECKDVASRLVERMKSEPAWFQESVLNAIHARASALEKVFSGAKAEGIQSASLKRLIELYRAHKVAHEHLYEVARVPEALDRGVGYYTAYLKDIIRSRAGSTMGDEEQARSFDSLTHPEEPSLYLQEHAALSQLATEIQKEVGTAAFRGSAKRVLMGLSPTAKEKIHAHRDKWWFWGYHGYGARVRGDLEDYLERIGAVLSSEKGALTYSKDSFRNAEKRRHELFERLRVPKDEQQLFRFFPRIGNAKLSRRYVQLRNFYFLDLLLTAIASKLGMTESHLRSLLPEELLKIANKGLKNTDLQALDKRSRYCVYLITGTDECILGGDEFRWVEAALDTSSDESNGGRSELRGSQLCAGSTKGIARIINRPDDALKSGFRNGDILVSQSGDPDIAKWIEFSSAVLIEQGGVTCHAAIICREFGKPGISGIPHLMRTVQNGDFLEVDAYRGVVRVRASSALQVTRRSSELSEKDVERFGPKSVALSKLRKAGLPVPEFFAVPVDALGRDIPEDARGMVRSAVAREVEELVGALSGPVFIIRSSMRDEDSNGTVSAGQYVSVGNIEREDVVSCVLEAVDRVGREFPNSTGSLFVQEMVLGDYSGVCFTRHPVSASALDVVIEAVPGGNDSLTDGEVTPAAYTFSRETEQFDVKTRNPSWGNLLSRDMLRRIVAECDRATALQGLPQEVEWTVKEGALWLLQSRAINPIGSGRQLVSRTKAHHADDIAAICRAYRVPPNLKLHLLRVAAVGEWICEHWIGPPIDRARIKMALLLHDIGNIVKADYERNPGLFPEEVRNLRYWIAIQDNVRKRFGPTDVAASAAMAKEIGAPTGVLTLMEEKQFANNLVTASSADFNRKIAAYADQRVSPHGVVTLEERLWEARERYRNITTASVNVAHFDRLVEKAKDIEGQLAAFCSRPLTELGDEIIKPIMDKLRVEKIF